MRRNRVAGIRLPATMASDRAWITAHRAARAPTQAAGWCAIGFALPAILPVPLAVGVVSVLVGAIAMLVLVLRGAAAGTRAARALDGKG
ncbi:SdpI family protein [Microbacteriaceae bacterium 4G12]